MVENKHLNDTQPSRKTVRWIQHPLIEPGKIEARLYQQLLAANVIKKGNTMIVAPTALGKTVVAALVAADRLEKYPESKILLLAPTKPLVVQHEERFLEFLKTPTSSLTGAVKLEERIKRWNDSQIICATPQTIESDIIAERYSLEDVSLLIFDECHRGTGSYSYVFLAQRYTKQAKNQLILGLTASPGGDKERINQVCQNLFINEVMVKNEDDPDVKPYFNPIDVEWMKVDLKKEQLDIKKHLDVALKNRLKGLKKLGVLNSTQQVSKKDILRARGKVQNRISQSASPPRDCLLAISMLTAVFSVMHSLELLETQGVSNLHSYFDRMRKKKTKAAKGLFKDENFKTAVNLTRQAYDKGVEHPKLGKLMEILKSAAEDKEQVIVFSQYRDTVNHIYRKCQEEGINAVKFFGQASREKEKGLTQKEQKDIIKAFRMRTYQVLISTSVAEEGIDIPSVDLVVLYEPVPSEIRMIQRRGRTGRTTSGRMIVLITKNTRDESFYYSSINRERMMKKQLANGYNQPERPLIANDEDVRVLDRKEEKDLLGKKEDSSDKRVVVYVDHRESKSGVTRGLSNLGVKVKPTNLPVADYQISPQVAVERKSTQDFVSSLMDKRLYKQAEELVENFQKPLIILEGQDLYSSSLHPNAIRGALASLAVDFNIPIIPTRNPEDTAAMIHRLAVREVDKGSKDVQMRTERKPLTLQEQQLFIVESLPSVGPVTARKLLEMFDSVEGVISASVSDLKRVDGIGDKIARSIRKIISSKYSDTFRYSKSSESIENLIVNGKDKPKKEYILKKNGEKD
ncbi:DEAD/DEAH box helicase [uncultured Methanobacterium sp.]|uniref:DEAD/DEAH box helicase n=1 Tax=uncultured Methanobacterium sp. TaxID=176306 RepID=UPI002AA8896B|nr:DEAD/DEAH box helicase [uncultured Methanobacterium sp.]